jgi:hypothetical protein
MTAAFQHHTTGPAYLSGRRCASPSRAWHRAPRRRNARPAKRVAGRKTASRIFFRATPKPRLENRAQVTGTHLESRTYRYVFAPGCVVGPNNTAAIIASATATFSQQNTFGQTFDAVGSGEASFFVPAATAPSLALSPVATTVVVWTGGIALAGGVGYGVGTLIDRGTGFSTWVANTIVAPVNPVQYNTTKSTQSKPIDAPPGTVPLPQAGLPKGVHGEIKQGVGAGPQDWTGIAPNGDVITTGPGGKAINNGPWGNYVGGNGGG